MSNKTAFIVAGQARRRNLRTGWILASIALAGFLGVFLRHWLLG